MSRRLMLGNSQKSEDVRFWLSGEDAPVAVLDNSYWVEKIQNKAFTLNGSNVYDSENKSYDLIAASNYAFNISNLYDFGHHWKLYFDMDALIFSAKTNDRYFLDFGSVTGASHALGFGMALAPNGNTLVSVNWKLNGNNSNPGLVNISHSYVPSLSAGECEPVRGYYAIVDGGDGFDRLEVSINGVKQRYNVKIPQVSYSPPWDTIRMYVGSGVTVNSNYKTPCVIRELKMVVID